MLTRIDFCLPMSPHLSKTVTTGVIAVAILVRTDVTWNSDDESLVASTTGQPRGDCPYSNNLDFCSGCATGQALELDDRRNSIHVTSVRT
ncbi:hypothetical protein VB774_13435 [Pseudanabaena galeata UHCC 0370]|uniref:Secreted protein n=1 Tax=Pseudanabaena galeata UHCC 0370 TaxID=3110310 RepID=A0ABU5TK43_9CYAN|nr:hypothetical protein [Pseudanabaena galeata]MEA5478625.1 hypothetical protein [Pseudanabaena galeata UHCC 0370]